MNTVLVAYNFGPPGLVPRETFVKDWGIAGYAYKFLNSNNIEEGADSFYVAVYQMVNYNNESDFMKNSF